MGSNRSTVVEPVDASLHAQLRSVVMFILPRISYICMCQLYIDATAGADFQKHHLKVAFGFRIDTRLIII